MRLAKVILICSEDQQYSKLPSALKCVFDFKKIFNKNFDIFFGGGGHPLLVPKSAISPKMSTKVLPMTVLFITESFSTIKIWMFAKNQSSIKN